MSSLLSLSSATAVPGLAGLLVPCVQAPWLVDSTGCKWTSILSDVIISFFCNLKHCNLFRSLLGLSFVCACDSKKVHVLDIVLSVSMTKRKIDIWKRERPFI